MSKAGIQIEQDFLKFAPKTQLELSQVEDIDTFKATLEKYKASSDESIKEQAWQIYRNLFGYPFIEQLLNADQLEPEQITAIIKESCQNPMELVAALQGYDLNGESQMVKWREKFAGENPWNTLLSRHPQRILQMLEYIANETNPDLDKVKLILKQSPKQIQSGLALHQIHFFESELHKDFAARGVVLKKMSVQEADQIIAADKSPEIKEFYQLLRQATGYIFDKELATLVNANTMVSFVAAKENIIRLAKCYNNNDYAVTLLRQLPPAPFLKQYLENKGFGVDSDLRDEAHWLSAVYRSQLKTKQDLENISGIISDLEHTYKVEPIMANAILANLTEYFTTHTDVFLDETQLEYFINKLLYSNEKDVADIQERLVNLILVNIQNRQAAENLANPDANNKKVPYLSAITQNLNVFDALRKQLESLENKPYSPDEAITLFQANHQHFSKNEYKMYLMEERNWNSFLLENKEPEKFNDLFTCNMLEPGNISMIAQACQSLLNRYDNLENKVYLQNLRNKCVVYAALYNDKWAVGNIGLLPKKQRKAIDLCLKANDKIDEKKARLYDAYHAKGYQVLEFLGTGSKKSIRKKIRAYEAAKTNIAQKAFQHIDAGTGAIKDLIEKETKQPHEQYNRVRNRSRFIKATIAVLGLGIPYVINKIWHGYSRLRDKVAHFVLGQGTIAMSGYKFWRKNNHVITDYFNGNPKPLLDMKASITSDLASVKEVRDYVMKMKKEISIQRLQKREEDKPDNINTLLENILQPPEKVRKDIVGKHAARAKEFREILKIRHDELSTQPQTAKSRAALAQLDSVLQSMDAFEKINSYEEMLLNRKLEHLEKHEQIKTRMPWLQTQDKLIETEDGKFCDVLHVKNAKNSGRSRPKKYALFFSGAEVTYVLDNRHFDYADNLEVDILAVQNRGMTEGSKARNMTASDLAKDGCAVIMDLINKGVDPNDISVIGYCGGSPAAALTVELMKKRHNMPVKLVLDRTFASVSEIAKDKIDKYKTTKPKEARFLPVGFAKFATSRVLKMLGWEVNVSNIVERMPRDQFMYYGIMPEKRFLNPTANEKPHGVDRTVPHKRSLHKGLARKRKAMIADLNALEKQLMSLSKSLGINIDLANMDSPATTEKQELQYALFHLLQVIHFQRKYLESPNVDAGVGDELHVANIKDFKLRDGTKLTDMVKAHIHQKKEADPEFIGGFLHDKKSPEAKAIKRFIAAAHKSHKLHSRISRILEKQFPDVAVSLSLSLNLVVGMLTEHANNQAKHNVDENVVIGKRKVHLTNYKHAKSSDVNKINKALQEKRKLSPSKRDTSKKM